jgi:YVTN family beta-propeller protein
MLRSAFLTAMAILIAAFATSGAAAADHALTPGLRRPVALAASPDGQWLYVANRDAGSISVVDLAARKLAAEHHVGSRLADLALLPGGKVLLAADEAAHELLVLMVKDARLTVTKRLAVSPYPVTILVAPGGDEATVASLWSRRLTFFSLQPTVKLSQVVDLPFAPRVQTRLPASQRLLVADAFGGQLALVDPAARKIDAFREVPGHNIRGLGTSTSREMLVLSHQMLNDLAHSIRNDIHWGLLMSNDLRWLKIDSLLAGGEQLYRGGHMHPLGESGRGGGDPGGLDIASDGTVIVAISGVNEVALGKENDFAMQRLKVGRRPTAVKLAADGRLAFVANTFDDSVSIIDVLEQSVAATIFLALPAELTLAQRGELLFYDARLSHDNWMSCHSCHTDGHTNGHMNDNFSDRSFGAAKRVLSLLGVKDTLPLAWTGQVQTFERQIHNSVENTMQREDTLAQPDVDALVAYLKTLDLPPPLPILRQTSDTAAIERGRLVFERHDCASCHAPPTYTSAAAYDVGLRDVHGLKEFNPPSLRGVSHRTSFFHDGRIRSLEAVFLEAQHPPGTRYSEGEIGDLTTFLMSL